MKTAIIDIGSNTVRLVIYKYDPNKGLREITNIKSVARLRTYIEPSGEMSEEGIQLLEDILASFKEILDEYEVSDIKAAATAAVRQATNQKEIVQRMREKVTIELDVLTEEEEAYFGFLAVIHSMGTPSAVTIDMGGGSTEITLFKNKKLLKTHSFPFGTVSLKQRFVKGNMISDEEKKELVSFVQKQFQSLSWIQGIGLPIIGIGGSARNVAQIHQKQKDYPISGIHQYEISRNDMQSLTNRLAALNFDQLKQMDGLSTDRADIIIPAVEVFRTLMDIVESEQFQFTRNGLREGLIINRILQDDKNAFDTSDVFEENARRIAHEYGRNEKEVNYLLTHADQLYRECCRLELLEFSDLSSEMIRKAAKIFDIGSYIENNSSSQHTFYLVANQSIKGMTHKERIKLALLASYKNKDFFRRFAEPFMTWYTNEELRELRDFGALLKFVYALNISKRLIVSSIQLEKVDDKVYINIFTKGNATAEKFQACRQKKHLERALKCDIQLNFLDENLGL